MWPLPEVGTILWCRFPEWPRNLPGPKPRPVLVMAVSEKSRVVKVAYGTSQHLDHLYSGEFAIRKAQNCRAFLLSGLTHDTKFNLNDIVDLPWDKEFFVPTSSINDNPQIGEVDDSLLPCISAAFRAVTAHH